MFLRSKVWPVRKADSLTPMRADYLDTVGSLTSHNLIGLHGWPVTGIVLLFFLEQTNSTSNKYAHTRTHARACTHTHQWLEQSFICNTT
jgi:hypothetical protein